MKLLRKPLAAAIATLFLTLPALAQTTAAPLAAAPQGIVAPRIQGVIENTARVALTGSRVPLASPGNDLGAVDPAMPLHGISLVFSRSPQQEAALQALLAAQQNPASPQYHQWLTPDQYAAQFGVAASDIAAAESWLQQQGFSIDSVARSHNRISFSGTAAQAASAFGAPIHNFRSAGGSTHFAPATDLTIPSALSSIVLGVTNLSSFRPHAMIQPITHPADPQFTSSVSGNHYIGPGDLVTLYDVKPVYQAGYNGINQSIAVIGQSAVVLSDIAAFQTAAGVTAKTPITVLMPGTGSSYISSGDEAESDLDLEYTSTMAPGAQVYFIYTGSNTNYGAFDSLVYAVDERIAPIISSSYGDCEPALGSANQILLDSYFIQASAQGQTIISAAGDQGSSGCYGQYTSTDLTDNLQLAIIYPAGSANVTAMGGTEIPTASAAASNSTYWTTANSSTGDVIASVKSYIPEQVWNDSVAGGGPDGGGGGASIYEARPSWQTGVTIGGVAIPSGNFRLIPDISMVASNYNAPLLYCTSDTTSWGSTQQHSCNSGFRDSSTNSLTVAGGTSFDAPIFSGMLALINQALNSTGQGNINPTLYSIASNPTTYASAFHDIALGGNQCLASITVCGAGAATTSFAAVTGYDEASGLGSIDLNNLLTAWPKPSAASLPETTTTIAAATTTPTAGSSDILTITVAPVSGTTVPTGNLTIMVDGGTSNGGSSSTISLANGSVVYSFSSSTSGAHIITATYSGSTTFGPSAGSLAVTVGTGSAVSVTTLSAATTTPASGATDNITITVTPGSGTTVPTGSVLVSVDSITVGTLTLTNGVATYVFSSTVAGTHIITATYNGNATYATSTGSIAVSVAGGTTAGSFTLTANPINAYVTDGSSGTFNLTITPVSGYTGTVNLTTFNVTPASLNNFCFTDSKNYTFPITVTGGSVSDTITFYTNATTCNNLGLQIYTAKGKGGSLLRAGTTHAQSTTPPAPITTPLNTNLRRTALAGAMACLLLTFGFGRRGRRLQSKLMRSGLSLAALALLSLAGFGLTACSNSAAPSSVVQQSTYTTKGTYLFTFTAQDSVNSALTAQGNVSLTVQ
jgi:hypothetical protein